MKSYTILPFVFLILNLKLSISQSVGIKCDFVKSPDTCLVSNDIKVTTNTTKVNFVESILENKNGFEVENMTFHYIPQGITLNLTKIVIVNSELKEITVENLMEFSLLEIANFSGNNIEILEKDLFKYNKKLKSIDLNFNKIKEVQMNAFENLLNLSFLGFEENFCFSGTLANKNEVDTKLKTVILSCWTHPIYKASYDAIIKKLQQIESKISLENNKETFERLQETLNAQYQNFQFVSLSMMITLVLIIIISYRCLLCRENRKFKKRVKQEQLARNPGDQAMRFSLLEEKQKKPVDDHIINPINKEIQLSMRNRNSIIGQQSSQDSTKKHVHNPTRQTVTFSTQTIIDTQQNQQLSSNSLAKSAPDLGSIDEPDRQSQINPRRSMITKRKEDKGGEMWKAIAVEFENRN